MGRFGSSNGMLADLPVHKAGNSYSTIVDGRVVFQEGYDGRKTKHDKFRFPFFPISSQHVNTINSIFLINCVHCTSLVFDSKQAFARTLEWYLTTPPLPLDKILVGDDEEGSIKTLNKLEVVSRSLGSKKAAFWMMSTLPPTIQDYEKIQPRHLKRRLFNTYMELLALTWGSSEVDAAFDDYQLLGMAQSCKNFIIIH